MGFDDIMRRVSQIKPCKPKKKAMPKPKTKLPAWANEPLKFAFNPEAALVEVLHVKPPRDWRKVIKTGRKTRR
jgi:hypothetical protein